MLDLAGRSFGMLRERAPGLEGEGSEAAHRVLEREEAVREALRAPLLRRPTGLRIRCHGDYHLGQVLRTDEDFIIIDFEGEPARPLAERREKKCPLLDVAGMIRSLHYAPHAWLRGQGRRPDAPSSLAPWAQIWYLRTASMFLGEYLATVGRAGSALVPPTAAETGEFLDSFILEKAVYELGYELNNRPDWLPIPLRGILDLVA